MQVFSLLAYRLIHIHRIIPMFVIALLLLPIGVAAQWIDREGKRLAETESMKSDGDFGAHIILTADDKTFRNTWNTSSTPPKLDSAQSVSRGAAISAMIVFHGCVPTPIGKCDVIVNFTLVSPDGKHAPAGSGPVWTDSPLQGKLLLSNASCTVGFDETDAVGAYRVFATVTDRVSGKTLQVSAPFNLL